MLTLVALVLIHVGFDSGWFVLTCVCTRALESIWSVRQQIDSREKMSELKKVEKVCQIIN